MPKVSIVIPVYNAEKFLNETLECVQNQTFKDFECVIVNDGSTDKSLEIVNLYVNKDSRFKVFTTQNSGCANIPRNVAIRNSISDYIFNLDADDFIELNTLEKMIYRQIETSADIVLLRMIGCINELEGELWRLPLSNFNMNKIIDGKEACRLTIGSWQIPCNGMLAHRDLFEGSPEGKYSISDEIASRHLLYKAKLVAFAETKYLYRNNNDSITRAVSPKIFDRILTDELLDLFISERFKLNDEICVKLRNTRLFNLIYLQYDFFKYKKQFSKEIKNEIAYNFRKVYNSQKLELLRKELPLILRLLFASTYSLFKISSFYYVCFKVRNGRKYQMK
ncbi:MAG: glycosyltransferase family 2 protein [Paludibacter sp.]